MERCIFLYLKQLSGLSALTWSWMLDTLIIGRFLEINPNIVNMFDGD